MQRIYFDNNATSPLLPEVLEAMRPVLEGGFGNASSIHREGQRARAAVEQAREQVARLLNARASEIVFTGGGTESDNTALHGILRPGDHLITSAIEHHAILNGAEFEKKLGCEATFLPVDGQGLVNPCDLRKALRPNTKLISVMMANNETGVLEPVGELARIAQEAGICFHTDAVQASGRVPVDVEALGCNLLSLSGHKLHAPQGVGVLYVRRGTMIRPLLVGGRQERGRRAGTENLAAIVGLGKAAELARLWLEEGGASRMAALRDRLEQGIAAAVPQTRINSSAAPRVPNTSNIVFECTEGEALVIAMDLKGVALSTGSACSSGSIDPSHVLLAMGLDDTRARASVRFSLGRQNTAEEVEQVLALLPEAVAHLRELSPLWSRRAEGAAR